MALTSSPSVGRHRRHDRQRVVFGPDGPQRVDPRRPVLSDVVLAYLAAALVLVALIGIAYAGLWLVMPSWR